MAHTLEVPASFQAAFKSLFGDCHRVMVERQRKYGPHNIPAFGELGTAARLSDKLERLKRFYQTGADRDDFADEAIEDTLIDIANYANILRAQRRGWWTKDTCPPLQP